MEEYQKIPCPFNRHTEGPDRNKLIIGDWSCPEFAYLADTPWTWTEKVDGTNIRVHWNGHKHTYGGRTDDAQLPVKLIAALDALFTEELFEQQFGGNAATLYGEGYGAGIQSGGVYRKDMSFILFDVRVGQWWLKDDAVLDVAKGLGIDMVPTLGSMTLTQAITKMQQVGFPSMWDTSRQAEGIVGKTAPGLLNRAGERLMVKVKYKDFHGKKQR